MRSILWEISFEHSEKKVEEKISRKNANETYWKMIVIKYPFE